MQDATTLYSFSNVRGWILEKTLEHSCYSHFQDLKCTSAEYAANMGRNRFRQYSLKRSVRTGRGIVKVDARESFFKAKIPTAMMCMSTRENIIELCIIGQNFPAVSYFGAYTFINCIIYWQSISVNYIKNVFKCHNFMDKINIVRTKRK